MAKGQTIGLLNFGIGGDDAEIQKIFEKQKKQAKELQDLYKSIGFGNAKEQKAAYKSMMDQQRKNAVNVARIGEIQQRADDRSLLNQQRLLTEVQRTEAAKRRAANVGVHGQNQFNAALGMTNKTIFSQRNLLQQLSNAAGIYFSIYQAGSFIKELAMISGEFEKQRLSLAAIIQDQEASTKIFNQIKDLAVYSPFNFKELTDYAKQLSAFSIPANEIFDTMKRLADVSAGLGVDMNRIILAYGQVRSASVLRGQELRQFTEAGIPLVDELAKKFGELENRVVSTGDVFDKISGRQVPFAMIKDIFEELTNEGGKFFEMQEIQAKSLSGMISNLRDAYDIMLDSIGQANSDMMKGVVGGLTDVMDNWERYWAILKGIIITFGTYKAILIAASVAQKGLAVATMVQRFIELTKVVRTSTAALAALNMVGLTNPVMAVAALVAAIAGLGYGMYKLATSTTELEDAQNDLQTSFAQEELTLVVLTNRLKNATAGTKEYETAKKALNSKYGEHLKNLNLEAEALITSKDAYAELTKEIQKNASERLYAQYTESASTDAGKRIGDEYSKIIKQLKSDVGALNYSDVLASIKDIIGRSDINSRDISKEFESLGLKWMNYSQSVFSILSQNYILAKKTKEFQDIFSTTGKVVNPEPPKEFSNTVKAINAAVDQLNIGDELKKRLKITDISKEFDTIKKDAIDTFNTIDQQLKDREAAPSLFHPDDIKKLKDEREAYLAFIQILGATESTKTKDTKDYVTERLKGQVGLIKDAKSEYEKLLKVMSPDEAGAKIKSMTAYSGIDVNNLTNEGYAAYLTDAISKISNRATDAAKDTRMAWNKEIAQIEVEGITEKFKNEFTAIEKYLSQYKEQYSLYEQLFGITGDKSGSLKSAFGDPSFAIKSVSDVLKEQMRLLPETSDEWRKLNDEVNSLEWSEKADFSKAMADLVAKYKSDEDKITAIKANGEEQRIKILENADNATDEVIQQRLAANKKATEESVSEIESESLKLTDFYQKLFGNLGDYGDRTLKSIINKTKDIISLLQNAEKNSEGKYDIEVDGKKITVSENDIARIIKRYGEAEKEMRKNNPFKTLAGDLKAYSKASTKEEKSEALDKLSVSIAAAGELAKQLGGDLSNMLSALGGEEAADAIGFVGELAGSMANLASGIASGNPVQMIQGIIGGIASIVNFHDKRLDRAIQKSQLEVKKLENAYANLERTIERQLGGTTKDQYKAQLNNLEKQRDELDKQRQAELKKKKVDKEAVLDYERQIDELNDTIKFFAEDLAKTLYDIDFKSWASDITSAIVDAFASGEDAVKAFDDTVADIMRNVIKNMIALEVLEPAMESVREYLFGKNGQGGVFGDGEFSENDAKGLVGMLAGLKDKIAVSEKLWDIINEAAKEAGIDLSENKNKDTLGASIQGLTENTGSLVASYLNAMRADLAQQKAMVERIAMSMENGSVWFAQIHARLVAIEINTRETADISAEIRELANKTHNILKDVTTSGSPTKMNIR